VKSTNSAGKRGLSPCGSAGGIDLRDKLDEAIRRICDLTADDVLAHTSLSMFHRQ